MVITFTGTRSVRASTSRILIEETIRKLKRFDPTRFVSGAAYGVDSIAALGAITQFKWCQHGLFVPTGKHNEKVVEHFERLVEIAPHQFAVSYMPDGTDFLDRDDAMVEEGDILVAFPFSRKEQMRSGTWATVRRARKIEMPIYFTPLDGTDPWEENT